MFSIRQRFVRMAAACSLMVAIVPSQSMAQSHVVSPSDLQKQAVDATQTRQGNLDNLTKLLSGSDAEKALKAEKIDPARIKTAVASLSDSELAQLNARATSAQKDFAAGRISDRDLLLILVGIAALILIIVAVH